MRNHLFVGSSGELFDTRNPAWSSSPPLRADYSKHFRNIETVAQFKATLRAGAYAWPGGYPIALITIDGAALCFDCGRREARNIFESIASKSGDGWRVVACDMVENWDSEDDLLCDHCSKAIGGARQ